MYLFLKDKIKDFEDTLARKILNNEAFTYNHTEKQQHIISPFFEQTYWRIFFKALWNERFPFVGSRSASNPRREILIQSDSQPQCASTREA